MLYTDSTIIFYEITLSISIREENLPCIKVEFVLALTFALINLCTTIMEQQKIEMNLFKPRIIYKFN